MASSSSSVTRTLTLDSTHLFLSALAAFSHQPNPPHPSFPPIPSTFPHSKLIPKTRFAVDAFRHAGDHSVSYFLSHFHSDHYGGLSPNWAKGVVFCSPITARLLTEVLKVSPHFVVALPLGEPVVIDGVKVVLIDANHCPGAVQFLFKIPDMNGKFESLLALSPDDVLPSVYLCTNKIAADHENVELNIGGSLVTSALEEACGTSRSKIREMYNELGDLGDVAQACRQTQKLLAPPSPLLIKDVFSALQKISVQTGSGSTVRKKRLILNLMRSCREKEMKFLVRTLVRNLRIGAMMKTVLPALAQAVVINSSYNFNNEGRVENMKDKLQRHSAAVVEAYNVLPNLACTNPNLVYRWFPWRISW